MIVGSWRGNKEILTFRKDKSFEIDDLKGKWFKRGKYLTIEVTTRIGNAEKTKRRYEVDEKFLYIEGQDGEMIKYRRRKIRD